MDPIRGQQENGESLRILYYSECHTEIGRTLYRTMVNEAPGSAVKVCRTMDCLANSIGEARKGPVIAVVHAENEEVLLHTYFIKHRLNRAPLLLVLPDREPETHALGFRIKPDSLCYTDSPVDEVILALRSILDSLRSRHEAATAKLGNRFLPDIDLTDRMSGNRAA